MAAVIAASCAGLPLAISSQAAAQIAWGQDLDAAKTAGGSAPAAAVSDAAAGKFFSVPTFDPIAAASMPVEPLFLASLRTVPGQRFDWRRERFSARALLDLSLPGVRRGETAVPPVYLGRFPAKLAGLRDAKQRKAMFIKTVLPLVLRVNDEVRATRRRMLSLIARQRAQGKLSAGERGFLNYLALRYDVAAGDFEGLIRRVDVVPASLALAQGAEESGWGTSRFARKGNAVFGQRTFRKGGGLVPLQRAAGQRYEVKAFNNLYTSVRSYVFNLNTHFAYRKFRQKRAAFHRAGQPLDSYALIGALQSYSERGDKYIRTIRVIMRANRLHEFDKARLLSGNGAPRPS